MSNDQVTRATDSTLSRRTLEHLRESLEEQRRFRLQQLQEFAAVPVGSGRSASGQREVHEQLVSSAQMVLEDVEAALARMDEGLFGRCELCARPIAPARLEIVPQARYCVRCHLMREAVR